MMFDDCCFGRYATESTMVRFTKIAMLLSEKTVRDVALRFRWMTVSNSVTLVDTTKRGYMIERGNFE